MLTDKRAPFGYIRAHGSDLQTRNTRRHVAVPA